MKSVLVGILFFASLTAQAQEAFFEVKVAPLNRGVAEKILQANGRVVQDLQIKSLIYYQDNIRVEHISVRSNKVVDEGYISCRYSITVQYSFTSLVNYSRKQAIYESPEMVRVLDNPCPTLEEFQE